MAVPDKQRSPQAPRKGNLAKLDKVLEAALNDYFAILGDNDPDSLHRLVLARVEKKLIAHVLQHTRCNQTRTATILGLSRSTLRIKIRAYGLSAKKPSRRSRRV